jgi:nucleotide-binding universal stress UspA family protein
VEAFDFESHVALARGRQRMFEQVVVGTDGSAGAAVAVDAAIELARSFDARLHVVHVHEAATKLQRPTGIPVDDLVAPAEAAATAAQQICDRALERAANRGVDAVAHRVVGEVVDALLKTVDDTGAELVVVGNRGMSGFRRFLGSVPDRLSHRCACSVLIIDTAGAREAATSA